MTDKFKIGFTIYSFTMGLYGISRGLRCSYEDRPMLMGDKLIVTLFNGFAYILPPLSFIATYKLINRIDIAINHYDRKNIYNRNNYKEFLDGECNSTI